MKTTSRSVRFTAPLILLLSLSLVVSSLSAQDRLDPEAMGKARASVASVQGISAVAGNPGGLDLLYPSHHAGNLTVSLYTFGGTLGATYLSSSDFQKIFGEKQQGLTNQEREELGELLQDEKLFANGGINLLTLFYRTKESGSFGFHYGHRLYTRINFPDGFPTLLATSNIGAQTRWNFVNRGMGGSWLTEYGFSYGKAFGYPEASGWFPAFGLGATLKLIVGVANFELDENSAITVDERLIGNNAAYQVQGGYVFRSATPTAFDPGEAAGQFQTALFPGSAGLGVGGVIGAQGIIFRREPLVHSSMPDESLPPETPFEEVTFGISLHDIGVVEWNTETYERSAVGLEDTISTANLSNEQIEKFTGTLNRVPDFSTSLPSHLRFGLGFLMGEARRGVPGAVQVDLEGDFPLNDVPGNVPDPRFSVGADWTAARWLSLRGGLSLGGVDSYGVGLGIGVRPIDELSIDVGSSELNELFGGNRFDLAARIALTLEI